MLVAGGCENDTLADNGVFAFIMNSHPWVDWHIGSAYKINISIL